MTENSVKRVMIGVTIAAATALTALAIGGLVVTSRGPQAQELPLARTSIVQVAVLDPTGGGTYNDSGADHPPVTQPPAQQGGDIQSDAQSPPVSSVAPATTTTEAVSALGGGAAVSSGTTVRRASDSSSTDRAGTATSISPPLSVPRTSIVTLSSAPSVPATDSKGDGASATRSGDTRKSASGDEDHNREVVSPEIRESDDEHKD